MEKTIKYANGKELQKIFIGYDRDNYSLKGYQFILDFLKAKHIKNFDVIQLCCMFQEKTYIELFGSDYTNFRNEKALRIFIKDKQKNLNYQKIDAEKRLYITWYNESLRELKSLNNYNY